MDELNRVGHGTTPPVFEHDPSATAEPSRDCHGAGTGFTLIETLVALTLVFVVLVGLATGVLVAQRASEALRAQRSVDRTLEATLESLRAGALPLRSGPLPLPSDGLVEFPVSLRLEVARVGSRGLHTVTVHAAYLRRGVQVERRLASQIWRPPGRPGR